ncbi:hypothetical protein BO82DRAFT_428029 [Aspergillus uvarum CBS 121591]|uniref:Uncharacterized protein n=1 Tax=Aspergillus uvarum CBS 121591 TaxID=1448315 RepID=A0A319CSL5_9EURO|nr:hypothetical protein BO82DRAFT_428029 [Aspergillus uvarum CBS 121591]PYH87281.1 hypothetical protein BO82DRAFT_428029 [Aspergillus uvarum CBS 121591]
MPSFSTSIVSGVAVLMVIGGAAANAVPPQTQTRNITVACPGIYCDNESYRSLPIMARGDAEGFVDATDDELDSSADNDATVDTCYNRSQCEVLAGLLAIVLIYSFCVLAYNRRVTNKYAAAEERERTEQATEMQRILAETTEIPFGARALEKGIQVEGIWTPKDYSPRQSTIMPGDTPELPSPVQSQPSLVPVSGVQRPTRSYQLAPNHNLLNPRLSMKIPDIELGAEAMRVFSTNSAPQPPISANSETETPIDPGKMRRSRGWFNPRKSWVRKPLESYKRMSKHEGHHRTSSESFRRRISKLIDESIQTGSTETYQLRPIDQGPIDHETIDSSRN